MDINNFIKTLSIEVRQVLKNSKMPKNVMVGFSKNNTYVCDVVLSTPEEKENFLRATHKFFRESRVINYFYVIRGFMLDKSLLPDVSEQEMHGEIVYNHPMKQECIVMGAVSTEAKKNSTIIFRVLQNGKVDILNEIVINDANGNFNSLLESTI